MPQCVPADQTGNARDIVHYARGTVLFQNNSKHEFLNLGEIVQVGFAWRLTDAPGDDDAASPTTDPAVQKIVDELKELDKTPPQSGAEIVQYNLKRADVLTRILAVEKTEQRDQWTQQVAECLSAAAQSGADADKAAYNRLAQLAAQVAKDKPGSNLAAYVAFREMQADYSSKLKGITKNEEYPALQAKWVERLSQYVQAYPKADDAPEALIQLGTVSEFVNKEVDAKNWYARLVKDFPAHASAAKAAGAVRRLESEGKPFELTANTPNGPFEIAKMNGKVVVIYYWASWNQQCVGDFARLKVLLGSYAAKGVELVCVNLDNEPTNPEITKGMPPCVQIAQPGGLDSPLATHYGIHSLPHMFLVGKDGNVLSRTVQVGNLEEELKKQIK
jgi:hypothetical protein